MKPKKCKHGNVFFCGFCMSETGYGRVETTKNTYKKGNRNMKVLKLKFGGEIFVKPSDVMWISDSEHGNYCNLKLIDGKSPAVAGTARETYAKLFPVKAWFLN